METQSNHTENTFIEIAVAVGALILIVGLLGTFLGGALDSYVNFIDWLYGRSWGRLFFITKIVFGFMDVGLIVLAVIIFRRFIDLDRMTDEKKAGERIKVISPQEELNNNWKEIQTLVGSSHPSDWNMAILCADAGLNDILNHLGYEGTTMAERLAVVDPTKLRSIDRIWSAHRLRNAIAHDPLQQHTRETILHALQSYEIAFQELGIMKTQKV